MAEVQAALKNTNIGGGTPSEKRVFKLTWDFATDGGATADTVHLGTVVERMLITAAWCVVETLCVGATSVTNIGWDAGDATQSANDDGILDDTDGAIAALVDNASVQIIGGGVVLGATTEIELIVATAALTAGKINVFLEGYAID